MRHTPDREDRRLQKAVLQEQYPDYDPRRHDAFVARYNRDLDRRAIDTYMANRNITG